MRGSRTGSPPSRLLGRGLRRHGSRSGDRGQRFRKRRLHRAEWRSDPASATYYWVASFSGDSHNNSFPGGCNGEPVAVALIRPRITWGGVQITWRRRRADGKRSCSTKMAGRGTVAVMHSAVPNVVRRDIQHAWHPLMVESYSGDPNTAATPHRARAGMSNSSVISPLLDLTVSTVEFAEPGRGRQQHQVDDGRRHEQRAGHGDGDHDFRSSRPATRLADHVAGLGASARITLVTTCLLFIPL